MTILPCKLFKPAKKKKKKNLGLLFSIFFKIKFINNTFLYWFLCFIVCILRMFSKLKKNFKDKKK